MPTKLFSQLHLLQTSPLARLSSMKLGAPITASRAIPIFCRVFPFKLKYLGLESRALRNDILGVRRFATRSFPGRIGSRSELKRGSFDGERVRVSKSLVEDEAELSDWVDELRSDSHRGRLTAEEDDSDGERGRSGSKGRGSLSMNRRRESGSDRFSESSRRSRDSVGSFSRNSRNDKKEEDEEFFSRRSERGIQGRNVKSLLGKRNGEEMRRGRKDARRKSYSTSEDDVVEDKQEAKKFMGGIGDFMSEEASDSENAGYDDSDDDILKKSRTSLFGQQKESKQSSAPRPSPERSDSYLTETRYLLLGRSIVCDLYTYVSEFFFRMAKY